MTQKYCSPQYIAHYSVRRFSIRFFDSLAMTLLPVIGLVLIANIASANEQSHNTTPIYDVPALETIIITGAPLKHTTNTLTASVSKIDTAENTASHPYTLLLAAPGTWISRGSGQEHLSAIRSPVFTGAGACGAFTVTQQSIAVRAPGFCNTNQLFDTHYEAAEALEIIRGPNGITLGGNALFGGINVQLPSPQKNNHQQLSLTAGRQDYYQLHTDINIAAKQNYRILATANRDNSFRESAGYTQQKLSLLSLHTLSDWSVLNTVSANHLKQQTAGFVVGDEAYRDKTRRNTNANPDAFRNVDSVRATSQWTFEREAQRITITPYARWSEMDFLQHFLPWQSQESNSQSSIGIRAKLQHQLSSRWEMLWGIDADSTQGKLTQTQANPSPFSPAQIPVGTHYNYTVNAINSAIFGQAYYTATTQLRLDFGLRSDYQKYRYNNHLTNGSACDDGVENCRFFRPADRNDGFINSALKFGALYTFNNRTNAYLSFANGFRNPQATELYRLQAGQSLATLKTVSAQSWEAGLRTQNKRLSSTINVFAMNLKDDIFQNSDRFNVNGLSSSHKGIEIANRFNINSQWTWLINGHYAEHRYRNNPQFSANTLAIKHNVYDTAPKVQVSNALSFRYTHGTATLNIQHMGQYFTNENNTHRYPGHTIANVEITHRWSQTLSTTVDIENITDQLYADRADFAFGEARYFPADRRHIQLTVRLGHKQNR